MLKQIGLCSIAFALSACATQPLVTTPLGNTNAAEHWRQTTPNQHINTTIELPAELSQLIQEALQHSPNLQSIRAKLTAAYASADIAGADRWPQLSIGLGADRNMPRNGSDNTSYTAGLNSSWEIDLWRKLSQQRYAAALTAEAAKADYEAGKQLLAANVARSWAQAISQQQFVQLVAASVNTYEQSLTVIEEQVLSGLSSPLDLRLLRAQAANSRAQLATANADLISAIAQLQVFLGRYPSGEMQLANSYAEPLPAPNPRVPVQMLEQRPDMLAAQLRYFAQVRTATAEARNWLPDLTLNADITNSSGSWSDLLDLNNLVRSVSANLVGRLFQGGRLRAQRARQNALADQLAADYAGIALNAFQEVETGFALDRSLVARQDQLLVSAAESREAEVIAFDRYKLGLENVITLLESQRSAFNAEQTLINNYLQLWANRISLYQALGQAFYTSQNT